MDNDNDSLNKMVKNTTTLKVRRKTLFQTIAEMIGKISPVDSWLRKNSLVWELYSASPTVDYSKTNYFLTKAIFYASEVTDNHNNVKYGSNYLFGATFGKPIVNSAAAFAFAKSPVITLEDSGEESKEINEQVKKIEKNNRESDLEYTQSFIDTWEENNEAELFKVSRNTLRDGDQYIFVKDDLSTKILSPDQVEIVDDKLTGELIGYDVETYVDEFDDNGNKKTVKYRSEYRKKTPFYRLLKFETTSPKEGETIEEETGDEDEERPLPIVGFHNERDANERYGNSEYQNCYYLMANYHAVLENAIKNNIYNSTATPVITGIDDMEKWLQANGVRNENGEYEVKWDANKLLIGGKDFDAKVVGGIQNANDADKLLNLLFWLICQTSETPEFVMGAAVQSSKASVSEQMPVAIKKAERKRREFKNFYRDLFKLVFFLGNKQDAQVIPNPEFSLSWPDIVDDDLKLNIEIVKTLSEEGCITDKTKMILLGMDKLVNDLDQEIEDARAENSEKAESKAAYGPSSILAKMSQGTNTGEELTPEERAIAEKVVTEQYVGEMAKAGEGRWVTLHGKHVFLGEGGGSGGSSGGGGGSSGGGGSGKPLISDNPTVDEIDKFDISLVKMTDEERWEHGDAALGRIYEKQGFNGKPKLVKEVTDKDGTVLYRGFGEAKYAESFKKDDKHFPGRGMYGSGSYTTTNLVEAKQYGGVKGDAVVKIALPKDAKITNYNDIGKEVEGFFSNSMKKIEKKYGMDAKSRNLPKMQELANKVEAITSDACKFAALKGYDAVKVRQTKKQSHYIIFNRGILKVEQ